jgi:multidrug transporter EmrE-like cation transporter
MSKISFALILSSVALSALAQISFKFGVAVDARAAALDSRAALLGVLESLVTPGVLFGLLLYAIGTLLWIAVLARVEVSQAYPFVGLGFVLTALLGYLLFGDSLGVQRMVGIALVVGGIALVAQS